MVLDQDTFVDLATHLEGASEGVLELTKRCVAICEREGSAQGEEWIALVDSLAQVNAQLAAIEQTLRALLEANREEDEFAKATLRRSGIQDS